ncbi:MAG: terminase, partial [Acinetobacter sp.]|nr:terminase [Acinetobacter sp.]
GDDIKREYPSIPSEAFQQSVEGAYYKKQFKFLYANGRVGELPSNDHLPVMTFWDLGVSDSMAIWFIRKISDECYQVIDYYENSGEGLRHYFKVLKDRGYTYSKHYAPHDIKNRSLTGDAKSRLDIAKEGYEIEGEIYSVRFEVVESIGVMDGIEQTREILKYCEFDETKCEEGISHLENYRKEWDDKKGCWKDKPLHDHTSHGADAFRMFGVAMNKRERKVKTRRIRGMA